MELDKWYWDEYSNIDIYCILQFRGRDLAKIFSIKDGIHSCSISSLEDSNKGIIDSELLDILYGFTK